MPYGHARRKSVKRFQSGRPPPCCPRLWRGCIAASIQHPTQPLLLDNTSMIRPKQFVSMLPCIIKHLFLLYLPITFNNFFVYTLNFAGDSVMAYIFIYILINTRWRLLNFMIIKGKLY